MQQRQGELVAQYLGIPDLHERMTLVLDCARKRPPLPPEQRTDEARVQGCVSRVWLIPRLEEGVCRFSVDAESALVRGLAALVCDVYEGAVPSEAAEFETHILDELGLAENLSPTRRHGVQQIIRAIREFARHVT